MNFTEPLVFSFLFVRTVFRVWFGEAVHGAVVLATPLPGEGVLPPLDIK